MCPLLHEVLMNPELISVANHELDRLLQVAEDFKGYIDVFVSCEGPFFRSTKDGAGYVLRKFDGQPKELTTHVDFALNQVTFACQRSTASGEVVHVATVDRLR